MEGAGRGELMLEQCLRETSSRSVQGGCTKEEVHKVVQKKALSLSGDHLLRVKGRGDKWSSATHQA